MKIETGLVEQRRGPVGHIHRIIKKKKRCTRRIRPPPAAVPAVALQRLFVTCRDVFKGPETVPSPADVHKLCHILDCMRPEDVGLSKDLDFFKPTAAAPAVRGTHPRVTCTTVYKTRNFSFCIFFLPATAVIPLHNHPGMTVFSKLLLGTMHIKAYDWAEDPVTSDDSVSPASPRLARLKANSTFSAPCKTSVLYPTSGGNIHEFTAITPCAVLDVLGPPYSKEDGRDCTYYRDTPYTSALSNGETTATKDEGHSYGWLEEIEMPEESQMDGIEYLGPRVIDTSA